MECHSAHEMRGSRIDVFVVAEYLLFVFMLLVKLLFLPVSLIGHCKPKKLCKFQAVPDPCLLMPAEALIKQIASKQLSCKFVIETFIARLKEANNFLNAIVEDRFADALLEAEAIDAKIRSSSISPPELLKQYPLLGLPITVKESISVNGMSHSAGCYNAIGKRGTANAEVIEKCKKSGGIIVAVTNTPELCMSWETSNYITGLTKNPYDLRRTCGGSSGGEGALLGAGASLIGVGSDVAGSLRLPASYCGIFAHKPTMDVVSVIGHYPDCTDKEKWKKYFNLGPMTRYAGDLLLMMKVLRKDEFSSALNLDKKINNVRIFYVKEFNSILTSSLDPEISSSIESLLFEFRSKYNYEITHLSKNFFKNSILQMILVLLNISGVDDFFYDKPRRNIAMEFLKVCFGYTKASIWAVVYLMVTNIMQNIPEWIIKTAQRKVDDITMELENILGDDGVLLIPTLHRPANFNNTDIPQFFDYINLAAFNVMGMPSTNCPIGINSEKLPFGVQIVSKRYNDVLSLTVARQIEKIRGGWQMP